MSGTGQTDARFRVQFHQEGDFRRHKGSLMGTIIPFLGDGAALRDSVFDPQDIKAMSMALDDVCRTLNLRDNSSAKEVIAARIIDLARRGERSPTRLRDRVLHEAGLAEYAGIGKSRATTSKRPPQPDN